jgi:restriction endonuclease Mrr
MARTTPDSHDLIPEVLDILKAESREIKRSEVRARIQPYLDRMKFDRRDRSIDWALNRLQKEGLALNTRRGFWKASAHGMAGDRLSEAQARDIMDRWTAFERRQRRS